MATTDIIAYAAAIIGGCLVCISFFMKTIIPLRVVGAGSNIGFIVYGILASSWPVLLLHAALLPINCLRATQMVRLTRRVEAAASTGDPSGVWLRPYMNSKRLKAGDVLFRKGDEAAELYYLAEGRIELLEIEQDLVPGRIFGEIAFFTPERRRTLTARCTEASTVLTIDEGTLKQLYYQNPEFGFHLVNLVARRLAGDVRRLEARLKDQAAGEGAVANAASVVAEATGDAELGRS
jgi:CRP/FNR family cyclic AMP-dependent transcriptional regulator